MVLMRSCALLRAYIKVCASFDRHNRVLVANTCTTRAKFSLNCFCLRRLRRRRATYGVKVLPGNYRGTCVGTWLIGHAENNGRR